MEYMVPGTVFPGVSSLGTGTMTVNVVTATIFLGVDHLGPGG